MTENHARLSPALTETVAGLSAGIASTLTVHPLDLVKTRLQIHRNISSTPLSSFAIFRSLLRSEHPLRALYRGLTPNLLGNSSSWALFFYFKSCLEAQFRTLHHHRLGSTISRGNDSFASRAEALTPADYFLSSLLAGAGVTLTTNPIWVMKTRMVATDAATHGAYPSLWFGIKSVWQLEGFRGFYRGLGVGLVGVTHGGVHFAVYDPLKSAWLRYVEGTSVPQAKQDAKLSNTATLITSGMAKTVAGAFTYPYQVLRSRLQMHNSETTFGHGLRQIIGRMWREEGLRGFYKGVGPNLIKVLPATWVTFLVYENVRYFLPRLAV